MTSSDPLSKSDSSLTPEVQDGLLAEIMDQLIQDKQNGQDPSFEQLEEKYPDLIEEIRDLWKVAQLAEEFGFLSGLHETENFTQYQKDDQSHSGNFQQELEDYELLEELGRGGMGVVYRARQKSLNRIVALKMVLRGLTAGQSDLTRFRAEAESAARLMHPNIVPVYEVGDQDGLPYFSMQYIEGKTLAQKLSEGPVTGKQAARLLLPVVEAIAESHKQGVLHRDLKPSNILIDRNGRTYVSDFGLAKQIIPEADAIQKTGQQELVTQTGAIIGTPSYMSPEQASGSRGVINPATDIYSLGAILYAMLTGHPPFQAASPFDTVMMVLEQDPVPPRVLNPQASRDLEMIALKCLQKPTDLRYQNAEELASDLRAYLADEPVSARTSHFTQILMRMFQESHHAPVLENWGLLWILHSIVILVVCLITNAMQLSGITHRLPYLGLWTIGLGTWSAIFWNLRRRSGPTTFIERQIAHVWAGSMIIDTFLYVIEYQLNLPVLTLSPVLGPVGGVVFLIKASMLSGVFYIHALIMCLTGLGMAWLQQQTMIPNLGLTLFGVVSSLCFFIPGLKYYRQSRKP